MQKPTADDEARAKTLVEAYGKIKDQMAKVIVGQEEVIEQLLIAVLARGHCSLEGVPGLAKTLMVRTLADAMDLTFHRIQFTLDLMPADITGTDIIQQDKETGPRSRLWKGAHFQPNAAGGRNQLYPTQDTGCATRGYAGAPCNRRRKDLRPRRTLLCFGYAESD